MNGYERYLENQIEVLQKEVDLYKKFLESQLKCRIHEEVRVSKNYDKNQNRIKEVQFKVITIPQSQYVIQID